MLILILIAAYLLGSQCFSILLSKLFHLKDPRDYGSKNPGTFNVWREYGSIFGLSVFFLDFLKSIPPLFLAIICFNNDTIVILVGLFVFLGHLYPVYYQFKGGKGVATFLGIIFMLSTYAFIVAAVLWILIALSFKYSSLAGILLYLTAPLIIFNFIEFSIPLMFMVSFISLMGVFKHRENVKRLLAGSEKKIPKISFF